jgi:hypothetical protein
MPDQLPAGRPQSRRPASQKAVAAVDLLASRMNQGLVVINASVNSAARPAVSSQPRAGNRSLPAFT